MRGVDIELGEALAQSVAVDPQSPRCFQLISTDFTKSAAKQSGLYDSFQLFVDFAIIIRSAELLTRPIIHGPGDQVCGGGNCNALPTFVKDRLDIARCNDRIARQNGKTLYDIPQLTDISRPIVPFEQLHCGRRELPVRKP